MLRNGQRPPCCHSWRHSWRLWWHNEMGNRPISYQDVALHIFYASIFYPFANFRQLSNCIALVQIYCEYMCADNYFSTKSFDGVVAKIKWCSFFTHCVCAPWTAAYENARDYFWWWVCHIGNSPIVLRHICHFLVYLGLLFVRGRVWSRISQARYQGWADTQLFDYPTLSHIVIPMPILLHQWVPIGMWVQRFPAEKFRKFILIFPEIYWLFFHFIHFNYSHMFQSPAMQSGAVK